ncbi:hypothetical protein ANO14919_113420 [Xylariales sp. No.14919]|nr:hypothetical protein ANO14919_113420 [Xylariales sp. No.14919]
MSAKKSLLACPFLLKSHQNHWQCAKYRLKRINDVKQHLRRHHLRPPYCPTCNSTFKNEEERDRHVRKRECEARTPVEPDGISEDHQKILKRRKNSKDSLEEQWYFIWETVFPNTTRPYSVYLNPSTLLRQYFCTEGVGIIDNVLNANNAVSWTLPENEADLTKFRADVLRGAMEKLHDGMNDFMTGAGPQWSPTALATANREPPASASSGLADTTGVGPPSDQVQTYETFHLDTTSLTSFSEIDIEAEGLDGTYQSENDFDQMWDEWSQRAGE